MVVPDFLLSRLYRRGSLHQVGELEFSFRLANVLGDATVIAPPQVEVNGIRYAPHQVRVKGLDVANVSPTHPFRFSRGDHVTVRLPGHIMAGGNRIRVRVRTREWGELDIYAEDKARPYCPVPGASEEE
ncbi:MAG TPA: hypothetical protein VFH47_07940 [Candidatus Thermoplasmatota archaeon]|nr:hypothetical protein [Candidatus Thermoplasmatota archaeon]